MVLISLWPLRSILRSSFVDFFSDFVGGFDYHAAQWVILGVARDLQVAHEATEATTDG